MRTLNQVDIEELLLKNHINRNEQLATLIKLINSFKYGRIIAIDGPWGSGKTVFVNQLQLLCKNNGLSSVPDIDKQDIENLQNNYTAIYYNAWENDYFGDALQSILYSLIARFDETRGDLTENTRKNAMSKIDISNLIQSLSLNAINLSGETPDQSITVEIREFTNRKVRIQESLQNLIEKSGKRVLFIVDELDRCSPSFAVKVLEVIKHYLEIDEITFIVAVNTEQLSHTVKKFYGNDFDGYGYLNKFFDFPFSLKAPNIDHFIERHLGRRKSNQWAEMIPADIASFLHMSMRETESFFISLELIKDYMDSEQYYYQGSMAYVTQLVFTPLALGLKIRSITDYGRFTIGKNERIISEFLASSTITQRFVDGLIRSSQGDKEYDRNEWLNDQYIDLFNHRATGNYHTKEIQESFSDIVNLISRYTTIPSKGTETP